jgi:Core-2/I-Branching enzyme
VTVAYLVFSHRNPEQVLRLVAALQEGPAAQVVVRHDQRRSELAPAEAKEAGAHLLGDEIELEWGGWSQVQAILHGLQQVRDLLDPDWLLTLSGQDYPLRPVAEIESSLAQSELDGMLGDAWELDTSSSPEPPRDDFFLRYAYRHYPAPRKAPRLPRRLRPLVYLRELPVPLRPRLGVRRLRLPFGPGFRCQVSADWLTLSRRALEALLDGARAERRLMRYYRRAAIPSESFFATVLLKDSSLRIARQNRRFASFPGPLAPHPDTLTSSDLERVLASGCDFARKFDVEVDAKVLDLLDERRRSRDPR